MLFMERGKHIFEIDLTPAVILTFCKGGEFGLHFDHLRLQKINLRQRNDLSLQIYSIRIKWISQKMDISKIPIFAKRSYFWSLTVSNCRSRAPESKSGIETEPNGPKRTQKSEIRTQK